MHHEQKYLIGRQPILNRDEQVCAYELLFRSAQSLTAANVSDASQATASVILNTLSGFGVQQILGKHRGFINLELDILMSDSLELLPKEMVVLELLETLEVTPQLELSTSSELRLPLRWVAILYGHLKADMALTTGVHTTEDLVKAIIGVRDKTAPDSALYAPALATPANLALLVYLGIDLIDGTRMIADGLLGQRLRRGAGGGRQGLGV